MTDDRITLLATSIVVGTGMLWGFYWMPVRGLDGLGLSGAWGTLAITAAGALALLPIVVLRRRTFRQFNPLALISVAVGGTAFALYSIGFIYGRVAIIILLFFLTPVWSTLIARYLMGWHTPRLRILAIGIGLAGLMIMLSAEGEVPVPRGIGEWMALSSGILWAIATTGIKAKSNLEPVEAAFVFVLGALAACIVLAPFLEPRPSGAISGQTLGLAAITGALWWGLSMVGLMWATVRLEPARVGILLMAEVLIGAVSAAVIAGEQLSGLEIIGGALVLCAGILEVWPIRRSTGVV